MKNSEIKIIFIISIKFYQVDKPDGDAKKNTEVKKIEQTTPKVEKKVVHTKASEKKPDISITEPDDSLSLTIEEDEEKLLHEVCIKKRIFKVTILINCFFFHSGCYR